MLLPHLPQAPGVVRNLFRSTYIRHDKPSSIKSSYLKSVLSVISVFQIVLLTQLSCSTFRHSARPMDFKLLAWNEDTLHSVQFGMGQSTEFYYTILNYDSGAGKTDYYSGRWRKSEDTIFLSYDLGKKPVEFTSFLVLEMQGNYLIQNFETPRTHMFLRIRKPIGRGNYPPKPWE